MVVIAVGLVAECVSDEIFCSCSFPSLLSACFFLSWIEKGSSLLFGAVPVPYAHMLLPSIVSSGFIISLSSRGAYVSFSLRARPICGSVCQSKYTPAQNPNTSTCSPFLKTMGLWLQHIISFIDLQAWRMKKNIDNHYFQWTFVCRSVGVGGCRAAWMCCQFK